MGLYIITGVSRGLGAALADLALDSGHDVVGLARTRPARNHARFRHIQADFADVAGLEGIMASIASAYPVETYDRILLINNAGRVEPIVPASEIKSQELIRSIHVNLTSAMFLTSDFLARFQRLRARKVIVNVSSGVAERPKLHWQTYSAAKAGLRSFSLNLAQEFTPDKDTRIHSFNPGVMDTEMQVVIRGAEFPDVARFRDLKRDGKLRSAETVAGSLFAALEDQGENLPVEISVDELLLRKS